MQMVKHKIRLYVLYFLVFQLNVALPAGLNISREKIKQKAKKLPPNSGKQLFTLNFKSRIDGSIQPLLVKVPENYTTNKKWPLLVTLHGLGDGPAVAPDINSMVQIGPYGRGSVWFTGIGREDVFECIETAREIFSIDPDRIYLAGFSMGAVATFNLGLRYPHRWAACVPVCGKLDELELVANGGNLPFRIIAGGRDKILPPLFAKGAYQKARQMNLSSWKYTEYENMGHSFHIDWNKVENWLLKQCLKKNPKKVTFTTDNLQSARAYWVEVTGLKQYAEFARIEAEIDRQKIKLTTSNLTNYTLSLNSELVDMSEEITVVENGVKVFTGILDEKGCFVKDRTKETQLRKRPGLSGPLWDIYSGSSILIYGSNSSDESLVASARRCAQDFANPPWMDRLSFRIISDAEVTKKTLYNKNIVLFGNSSTNRILAEISDTIPVKIKKGEVLAKDEKYSGQKIEYVLIYPNPLNHKKYVAVFAGNSPQSINCFNNLWPQFRSAIKEIDYGIFEMNEDDSVKWLAKGIFGTNWDWQ